MAVSRKRKHASTNDQVASKHKSTSPGQTNIKVFAGISKDRCQSKKRKVVLQVEEQSVGKEENEALQPRHASTETKSLTPPAKSLVQESKAGQTVEAKGGRKRKAPDSHEETSSAQQKAGDGIFKHFANKPASATPRAKRFKSALPPSPVETPSKCAAALFSNLQLDTAAQPIPFPLDKPPHAGIDTPPLTPDAVEAPHGTIFRGDDTTLPSELQALPSELQDLAHLHAAFLSALSMHYAHNGTASPVYIHALCPQITKTWKKRTVTLEDLRRILPLSGQPASFVLEDFSRAGVCLSRVQPRGRATKRIASYIDEEELNQRVENALQKNWHERLRDTQDGDKQRDVAAFVAGLPLAPIIAHESVERAAPLFARGAQRLADLKSAQSTSQSTSTAPTSTITTSQKTTSAIATRGTSLLDRILAKASHTSNLPSGPTKQQLERHAALHRCEDIARVLSLLAGSKPRSSFSMPAVVQHLQQSLRNPISREEVERCLEVMAAEVTPGFVSVVISGSVKGVVISRTQCAGSEELRERVQKALALQS